MQVLVKLTRLQSLALSLLFLQIVFISWGLFRGFAIWDSSVVDKDVLGTFDVSAQPKSQDDESLVPIESTETVKGKEYFDSELAAWFNRQDPLEQDPNYGLPYLSIQCVSGVMHYILFYLDQALPPMIGNGDQVAQNLIDYAGWTEVEQLKPGDVFSIDNTFASPYGHTGIVVGVIENVDSTLTITTFETNRNIVADADDGVFREQTYVLHNHTWNGHHFTFARF
ncbi:MAG: CHAP domain-containing protein [Bifidobacteriaceae bacterium]|jgi:hypothetical protein|nr:CHAP domain-containing protein [Bifidobacteriaceae bacterium]